MGIEDIAQVLGFARERRNWRRKKDGIQAPGRRQPSSEQKAIRENFPAAAAHAQPTLHGEGLGEPLCRETDTSAQWGVSPSGPVQRPCGVCRGNTAIDWPPWEASNSDWVHSRLSDTGYWSCGNKDAGLLLAPLSEESAIHRSARHRQEVCSQRCALPSGLPRNPPAACPPPPPACHWAICPCPQQHTHSFRSSCGASWSLWGDREQTKVAAAGPERVSKHRDYLGIISYF